LEESGFSACFTGHGYILIGAFLMSFFQRRAKEDYDSEDILKSLTGE